jgi:SsrA-binding protein
MAIKILVQNRKAFHEYEIIETFEAGLVLRGTEVKSIREGQVHLADGWVNITPEGEAFLMQVKIAPYSQGNIYNHTESRPRKLLLHRKELIQLEEHVSTRGNTLIPLKVYLKASYVKVELALARGKKLYDKRQTTKKRETQREIERDHKIKVRV